MSQWSARLAAERDEALVWIDEEARRAGVTLGEIARTALVEWLGERLAGCMRSVRDSGQPVEEFPVVERLLATSAAAWRRRTSTLFDQLVRDAADLGATTTIVGIQAHGERLQARSTTLGLTFDNGARWFYRSRDRSQGAWFLEVCAALDAAGLSTPLHVRRLLLRPGCSWDECVTPAPCRDAGEIRRYFTRAGMLVRLVERFAAVDLHARNVMMVGEYPVLVDVETLFVPQPPFAAASVAAMLGSPLRSGLLGVTVAGAPGRRAIEGGGLHPGGVLELPFDDEGAPMVEDLQPTIPAPIGDHIDDLLAGWDEMDACLARTDLSGLLARAPTLHRRELRVNGGLYHQALAGSLAPELLRSESARDAWLATRGFSTDERAGVRDLILPRPMVQVGNHPAVTAQAAFTDVERRRRHDLIRSVIALRDDRPASGVGSEVTTDRLGLAVELGDRVLALRFADSRWHAVRWLPGAGARTLDVTRACLYDGNAGIAVVLAMLARATGHARFADAARGALEHVPDDVAYTGIFGLGGAIYALARCGQLLDDAGLRAQATTYVTSAPATAAPWDAIMGVAGFVLGAAAARTPPRGTIHVLHDAWRSGLPPPLVLEGGVPACAPDLATGVACALARGDIAVPVPAEGALAWRLMLDPTVTIVEPPDPLDRLDVALAAFRGGATEHAATIRACADALVERRRTTGRWFPTTSVAERHMMSIVDGIPAIIHALLCAEDPHVVSIRRLE